MLHTLSGKELSRRFKNSEINAVDIAELFLKRIKKHNPKLNAFLSVFDEKVMEKAKALDAKRERKEPLGKMAAIPVGIKDNIIYKDEITTCGSQFLKNFKAPYQSTVCELLEAEDALILGKLNLDEFGMGSTTEYSSYCKSYNPWDLTRTPGGSSGGASAAIAARLCSVALGSDTGGSVRQPASFCGVYGLKPTYGRVSRFGLVAFASSLDQIGPLTHHLDDLALTMEVIGRDCEKDSTCFPLVPSDYEAIEREDLKGVKIGIPYHFLETLNSEAKLQFTESIELCQSRGAELIEIDMDILKHSSSVYYLIATAEAATNLARFDGVRYGARSASAETLEDVYKLSKEDGFGFEVKRRILMGVFSLSKDQQDAYFKKAQKVRTLIIDKYQESLEKCDVIAMPTSATTAFPLGSMKDPVQMYLADLYTTSVNLSGLPALSVPTGFSEENLPWGLQLIGSSLKEPELVSYARVLSGLYDCDHKVPTDFKD